MRLCRFDRDGALRLGVLSGDTVIDLLAAGDASDMFTTMRKLIEAGAPALEGAARRASTAPQVARFPLSSVRLEAPLMPSTVLCSGSNYHSHNAEKANTPLSGKEPEFFVKTSDCVIGPGEMIICDPVHTQKLDCEAELAVIIGKPGRHIPVADALDHVFGYTVANDVTARDRQVRQTAEGLTWYELGSGKAFDTSLPLGPVIVTADEIPDPQQLTLRSRVNGELRQHASTAEMIWTCADLVHFFSINFTLKPGMVILTGTPAGTAWSVDEELGGTWTHPPGLTPAKRYCLPGDEIECEIDEIGVLSNTIAAP
ncbi:MAG: fumarylacetoacetate hydrolase family protein [Alphaproteobacteria bacterium]|nr:fumarylacetoacetate hydrolase family protein [Alphaproteobacteria bacterium]